MISAGAFWTGFVGVLFVLIGWPGPAMIFGGLLIGFAWWCIDRDARKNTGVRE